MGDPDNVEYLITRYKALDMDYCKMLMYTDFSDGDKTALHYAVE
jgi:hypothetical protein